MRLDSSASSQPRILACDDGGKKNNGSDYLAIRCLRRREARTVWRCLLETKERAAYPRLLKTRCRSTGLRTSDPESRYTFQLQDSVHERVNMSFRSISCYIWYWWRVSPLFSLSATESCACRGRAGERKRKFTFALTAIRDRQERIRARALLFHQSTNVSVSPAVGSCQGPGVPVIG